MAEAERSRSARAASESALVRVVHHYGARPEFVVRGGLVPEMLCAGSAWRHAGTTDVDVQVDLEIACGAVNTARLETALRNAEFEPDTAKVWRWVAADGAPARTVVKFELLADLETEPNEATVHFDACESLGAVNLRGTGFASRDVEVRTLTAKVAGAALTVEVNVCGLAGYLLAKAAAKARRTPKDWYDIAFVLLHNDRGGPRQAADAVLARFDDDLVGAVRTSLDDLLANFTSPGDQGPSAYAEQMHLDHPELDLATIATDATLGVEAFHRRLFGGA